MTSWRRALFVAMLASTACEQKLEVLSRTEAPDAAPPLDAAPDGADGSVSSCGGRLDTNAPCTRPDECCSGLCALDATGRLTCRPATGCVSLDEDCTRAGACCSLSCAANTCKLGLCAPIGSACTEDSECCSDRCEAQKCAATGAACLPAGEPCVGSPDCCSNECNEGHCSLLQACRVHGETCSGDADCCSGRCKLEGTHGFCDVLAQCTSSDGKPCKAQVGELCKDDAACCSRSCQTTGQGPKRCAPSGGCRAHCEVCETGAECCSGECVVGADGAKRCGPPTSCLPAGEVCEKDDQCCGKSPKPRCFDDPPGIGAKRCHDATTADPCEADGVGCAVASQCCGSHCVLEADQLACAGDCRADGESCTARADCCGEFSDCLVLNQQRICAPSVR